jgi:hypothetical protein
MDDKKTALQESVERIKSWVTIKYPKQASRLLPGLTDEEIEGITRDLPCPLPAELRCLYKSVNGFPVDDNYDQNLLIWDRHILLPLQEAMDRWKRTKGHVNRLNSSDFFLNPAPEEHCYRSNCFAFLSDWGGEGEGYAIIDANDLRTCKVIFTIKRDEITCRYISLTALVQSLAEWYKQGNLIDTNIVDVDNSVIGKYYHTWKKYNTYTDLAAPFKFIDELYEWQSNQISATTDFDFIDDSSELTPDTSFGSIDELDELYEWQSNQISAMTNFGFIDDSSEFTPDYRSSTIW